MRSGTIGPRWAFEQYALGDRAIRQLVDALDAQGLRTREPRKCPATPLTISGVHHLLRDPYYFGVVPYRGVYHEGKHQPLVSPELWLRGQDVLTAHHLAGSKERKHPHHLGGSIFCGECGARLIYSRNRGHGGEYEYYTCRSRRTGRRPCTHDRCARGTSRGDGQWTSHRPRLRPRSQTDCGRRTCWPPASPVHRQAHSRTAGPFGWVCTSHVWCPRQDSNLRPTA
jgi:hypothetical protein